MWQNLTQRERTLAMVVAGLAPLFLLMVAVMWVNSSLGRKEIQVRNLTNQLEAAQRKRLQAASAARRNDVYRMDSLPGNINLARTQYHHWLMQMAEKDVGLKNVQLTKMGEAPFKNGKREDIFVQLKYKLAAVGTLQQLSAFLYDFRRIRLLHRISSITINPINLQNSDGTRTRDPSEELSITLVIDAISLSSAPQTRDFSTDRRAQLARSLDDYHRQVVHRDILGNANTAPSFARIGSQEAMENARISFPIQASDKDHNDELTFELIYSSVVDATIRKTGANQILFECPPQAPGRYDFEVQVTDNGFPPKTATSRFDVVVRQPVVERPPPPEPKFQHATETVITAVTKNRKGEDQVWVNVKTTGDLFIVSPGQSFELDDAQWIVFAINGRQIQLDCAGRRMTFRVGDRLNQPMETVSIAETPPKSADDDSTIN